MSGSQPTARITITLPKSTLRLLKRASRNEGMTVSALIRRSVIRDYPKIERRKTYAENETDRNEARVQI
jgi:hypothetical protein